MKKLINNWADSYCAKYVKLCMSSPYRQKHNPTFKPTTISEIKFRIMSKIEFLTRPRIKK